MRLKTLIILGVVAFAVTLSPLSSAWAFKIAVIDLQRVLMESNSGKVAKDLLESSTQSKKESLDKMTEEMRKLKEDYDKKAAILTQKARADLERKLMEKQQQLQQAYQQFQTDLQKQDSELTRAILKNIDPIVKDIAEKEKIDLVLERTESGIMYAPEKVDITDRVIRLYNEKKK